MSATARDVDEAPPVRPAGSAPSLGAIMGQARQENFPVASRFLPQRERRQLLAIYGVARLIDDVGDEIEGDRRQLLNWLDAELDRVDSGAAPEHPAMRSLAAARIGSTLPVEPFRSLVQANRQDQDVLRYETFEQLLGYCRLSAAPVGELVLHAFDAATPDRLVLSEHVCAGLQVVEHIQDVVEDYARGRIYMPQADMDRFGCSEADLAGPRVAEPMRTLLAFESERARHLLDAGAPLVRTLPARPRVAVACFIAGGRAALDALARAAYDVGRAVPPRPSRREFAGAVARAAVGR